MTVSNGQLANQTTFNTAFMSRTAAQTDTVAKVDLLNADAASGSSVVNVQREMNGINSQLGKSSGVAYNSLPTWTNNDVGTVNQTFKARSESLTAAFNASTGHTHDGTTGSGGQISATDLGDINYYRADYQVFSQTGVTGTSTDVSTFFTGSTPGGAAAVAGVITDAPNNKVYLLNSSTGQQIEDAGGQRVYGRITESSGVWTLSYYTNEAGVETAYSFSSTNIDIYYRVVFTLATVPTIPADVGSVGSLDLTADVVDASATQRGLVSTGTQTFAGNKTFTGTVSASNLSGTNTGDQTISLTGDVTGSGNGSFAATIAGNVVTNAKLATMATASFKGRTTAGTGNVEDLTATQSTAILDNVVGDSGSGGTKGLVPAPGAGDAAANKFLKASGAWAVVSSADVLGPASSVDNAITRFDGTTGKLIQNSAASVADNGGISSTISSANTGGGVLLTQTFVANPGSYGFKVDAANSSSGGGGVYAGYYAGIIESSGSDIYGFATDMAHSGSGGNIWGFAAFLSGSGSSNASATFYAPTASINTSNYAALRIDGVSSGTVAGYNDAIHVTAGRTYLGGTVNLNGATASTFAYFDASKNLVSQSAAAATALLSNFVGDSGSGGTKGLVPAPSAGDAAAGRFLKADGTFAVPPGTGGGVYTSQDFTGTTFTATADGFQKWRFTDSTARTLASISVGSIVNGAMVMILSTVDTPITLNNNDVSNGWILNGPIVLYKYSCLLMQWDATLARFVEVSRRE